jgi:hypothetical protein
MTAGADKPSNAPQTDGKVHALQLSSADVMALALSQATSAPTEFTVVKAKTTTADVSPPAVVPTQQVQQGPPPARLGGRSGVAAQELNSQIPLPAQIINPDGTRRNVTPVWNLNNTNPGAAGAVQQAVQNRDFQDKNNLNPNGTNTSGSDGLLAANPDAARQALLLAQAQDPHSDLNAKTRLHAPLNEPYGYSPGAEQFWAQYTVGALAGFTAGGPLAWALARSANYVDKDRKSPFDIVTENGHASAYKNLSDQLRAELTTTQTQITALEAKAFKGPEADRFAVLTSRAEELDHICPTEASSLARLEKTKKVSDAAVAQGHAPLFTQEEFELFQARIESPPGRIQDEYTKEINAFAEADKTKLSNAEALRASGRAPDPAALDLEIRRLETRANMLDQLDTTPQGMARRAEEMTEDAAHGKHFFLSQAERDIAARGGTTDVKEARAAVDEMRKVQAADHTELSAMETRFTRAERDELARLTARRDVLTSVLPEKGRTSANLASAAEDAIARNKASGGQLLTANEERMVNEQAEALKNLKPNNLGDRARALYGNAVREGMFNTTKLSQQLSTEQNTFFNAHQTINGYVSEDAATLKARDDAARARTTLPPPDQLNAEMIERDRLKTRTELFTAGTSEPDGRPSVRKMQEALATIKGDPAKRSLFSETPGRNEIAALEARLDAARATAATETKLKPGFWSATDPEMARGQYFKGPLGNAAKGVFAVTLLDGVENYTTAIGFHDNQHKGLGSLLNAGIFTPMAVGNMFHTKEGQERGGVGNLATKKWVQFGVAPIAAYALGKGIDTLLPNALGTDQYSFGRALLTPTATSNAIIAAAATLPLRPGARTKFMAGAIALSMLNNLWDNGHDDHYRQAHAADDATADAVKSKSGSSLENAIDKWDVIGNARSQYIADRVQVFGSDHAHDTDPSQQLDDRRTSVIMRTALGEVMLQKGFSNAIAPNPDPNYRDEGFTGDPLQFFKRAYDSRDSTQQIQDANHILAGLNIDLGSQALTNFQLSLANIQRLEAADPSQTSGLEDVKARISKSVEKIYGAHDIPKVVDGLIGWINQGQNGADIQREKTSITDQIQAQEAALQQGQPVDQRALAKACRDVALIDVALAKSKTSAGSTDSAAFFNEANAYLAKSQQYYPQDNADILAIQQINGAAAARGNLNVMQSGQPITKGL